MNIKLKYFLLVSLVFTILLANLALASPMVCNPHLEDPTHQVCVEIKDKLFNTTTPIINVTFKETVSVNQYKLYRIGDLGIEYPADPLVIGQNYQEINMTKLTSSSYMPNRHVNDGVYLFRISAFNVPNINIDVAVMFSINGSSMNLWVTNPVNMHVSPQEKPNFAVSNNSIFFLEVQTEREIAECKFSPFNSVSSETSLEDAFIMFPFNFSTNLTNNKLFYVSDFNISMYYAGYSFNGELGKMYVICKEPQGKYSYGEIWVGVDKTAPIITILTNPNPVIDVMSRETNLSIITDDRSVCMIKIDNKPQEAGIYPVINRTYGYDVTTLDEFFTSYNEQLVFSSNPLQHYYNLNVTCYNLANLMTNKAYTVDVDLEILQSFKFYSPQNTIKTTYVFVNGSTTIGNAVCMASLNKTNPTSFITLLKNEGVFDVDGGQIFTGTIQNVPEGNNVVYVNCTYMGTMFSQQNFKADRTPPTAPNITMDENTCSLTKVIANVKSRDVISGIKKYYYNLTLAGDSEDEYSLSGTTTSEQLSLTIRGNRIDGRIYTLKVWAEDNAGNIGPPSSDTIKVTNTSLIVCDKTDPRISMAKTKDLETNEWTVKINCTDYDSGCKSSFLYGIQKNASKTCNLTLGANLLMPITVTTTATFCATVFDNNNNNDSGEYDIVVNYPISCSNAIKDGTETDLDCGGECPKCNLNQSCLINSDCYKNYCLYGKCAEPKCNDTIKNGGETGTDCGGGTCPSCGIGGTCVGDSDCGSHNCMQGICTQANCSDFKYDGQETDLDCGGNCKQCNRGDNCIINGDCETNYCDSITKICSIDPTLDTDGDGLPDIWEENVCKSGNFIDCDPNGDQDGDGYTNLEEYKDGTDPLDPASHPDFKKYNTYSLILLILGVILLIAGIIIKVMDVLEEQKIQNLQEEKEMTGTLSQIPKLTSLEQPQERKISAEENEMRLQSRNKTLKLREFERKKVLNQFDLEDKDKSNTSSKTEQKIDVVNKTQAIDKTQITEKEQAKDKSQAANKTSSSKKTQFIDSGSKEDYFELSSTSGKKADDAFSKLKEITSPKKETENKKETEKIKEIKKTEKTPEIAQKIQVKKQKKEDEVFEKLKKITKQTKDK